MSTFPGVEDAVGHSPVSPRHPVRGAASLPHIAESETSQGYPQINGLVRMPRVHPVPRIRRRRCGRLQKYLAMLCVDVTSDRQFL